MHLLAEQSKLVTTLSLLAFIYIKATNGATGSYAALNARHKTVHRPMLLQKPDKSASDGLLAASSSLYEEFTAHRIHPAPVPTPDPKNINSSLILEDLVNQFLEKNKEAVRHGGDQALGLEGAQTYHVHKAHHGTPVERSSGETMIMQSSEHLESIANGADQVFGGGNNMAAGQVDDEIALASRVELQQSPQEQSLTQQVARNKLILDGDEQSVKRHLSDYKLASDDTNELATDSPTESTHTSIGDQVKFAAGDEGAGTKQERPQETNSTTNETPANVTTVNTTSVVIDSPPTIGQDQLVSAAASGTAGANLTGRSLGGSMIQARSMYSGSGGGLGMPGSKAPQHTRPPYATHDQFTHKSSELSNLDVAASTATSRIASSLGHTKENPSQQQQQQHETQIGTSSNLVASTEPAPQPQPSRGTEQIPRQMSHGGGGASERPQPSTDDKLHKLTNTQLVELSPVPIGSSGGTNSRVPVDRGDSQADRQLQFSKDASSTSSMLNRGHNDRYASESGADQPTQSYVEAQKLYEQSASTFNDLSSSGGGFYLSGKNYAPEHLVVERDSKGDEVASSANENQRKLIHHQLNHQIDLSPKSSSYLANLDHHGSSNGNSNRYQQQLEISESQRQPSTSNNNNDHDPNTNTRHQSHTPDHLGPGASGALLVLHRTPPPTHYAASLVNVTAPMVLPLSASEAMESALGGGQAAKTLLNQVSGLLRPAQSLQASDSIMGPSSSSSSSVAGNGNRAQMGGPTLQRQSSFAQNQQALPHYYMPGFSGPEPIYSQPANQFSPPPPRAQINTLDTPTSNNDSTMNSTSSMEKERMRLDGSGYIIGHNRRPSYQLQQHLSSINMSQPQNQASGFRSPPGVHHSHLASSANVWSSTGLSMPSSYLSGSLPAAAAAAAASAASGNLPTAAPGLQQNISTPQQQQQTRPPALQTNPSSNLPSNASIATSTTNGFITGATSSTGGNGSGAGNPIPDPSASSGLNRRVFNLTRVEHISAECSNDLIRTVIVFNGTFKGIIYSSGYVRDPNCLYINGTGKTRYDFSIRLNQCGTLGRQELHPPVGPNEVRRRDQVMWNTLSIQYNPIIEQEWDEHFRVSCEYGSDFWKTISFSPFNVETNTGSPVVFTVDPPQCQMEILRGHGMVGPRQEAVSGPVTVGDPLTLLIHMKSEKAGYDILVKNCIAHDGAHQKMQLIDSNGCVVNERFISPFRGTYNDNDLKHVTLYSYLKAFRFTGSPVLYLECEIHMCQSSCPPQMCYWRRLSKRSANETSSSSSSLIGNDDEDDDSNRESTTVQLEESNPSTTTMTTTAIYKHPKSTQSGRRKGRMHMQANPGSMANTRPAPAAQGQISDKVSLFQALEVRQERSPDASPYSLGAGAHEQAASTGGANDPNQSDQSGWPLMCYRRTEVLAFLFTAISLILVALSVTVGCCWRAASLRVQDRKRLALATAASIPSANSSPMSPQLSCGGSSYISSGGSMSPANNNPGCPRMHQAVQEFVQSSASYRKALNTVGPILVQHHHSKQRHKECLLSPSY